MGQLTDRFGIRPVAASCALLALAGSLALVYLANHGLMLMVLAVGVGCCAWFRA